MLLYIHRKLSLLQTSIWGQGGCTEKGRRIIEIGNICLELFECETEPAQAVRL